MKLAILSDVHANLQALEAVLADASSQGAEGYLSLGDHIGFNGDPAACRYKSRACTWAGDVYEKKDLHDEALRYNKRAYQYARKADVPTVEVYTLRDIGRSYSGLKRNDIAIP